MKRDSTSRTLHTKSCPVLSRKRVRTEFSCRIPMILSSRMVHAIRINDILNLMFMSSSFLQSTRKPSGDRSDFGGALTRLRFTAERTMRIIQFRLLTHIFQSQLALPRTHDSLNPSQVSLLAYEKKPGACKAATFPSLTEARAHTHTHN